MSGHSRWAKIKRAKGAADSKKGALFTKLAKNITMAAQEGGGDPDMNFTLRLAIDKAKQANMPLDNIERSIKKGTGEMKDGNQIARITYEFITNFGVNGLIDCSTDNTNRTVSEVRNLIEGKGSKLAEPGSVSWGFKEQGEIQIGAAKLQKSEKFGGEDVYVSADPEELEMMLLELDGVLDYEMVDGDAETADNNRPADRKYAFVTVAKDKFKAVIDAISEYQWQILDNSMVKVADSRVELDDSAKEKLAELIDALEDRDDVDSVWTNAKE